MMHVAIGTDFYGRVKTVGETSIVTRFGTFQHLPFFPLQSFYIYGYETIETFGNPFVAGSQPVATNAIPLAKVDKISVTMTFIRALLAIMLLAGAGIGSIILVAGDNGRPGERETLLLIACSLLGFCAVFGTLTYVVPLTSHREREIRRVCAVLLGLSVDPARLPVAVSIDIAKYANERFAEKNNGQTQLVRDLILARANISQLINVEQMELKTDELLDQIKRHDETTLQGRQQ
jgi:hypothetical protein